MENIKPLERNFKLVNEDKIIESYIKTNYPDDFILVVWLDSADDNGIEFLTDMGIDNKFPQEEFCLVDGYIIDLKSIIRKYHAKQPYMQLYIRGKAEDANY